MFRAGTFQRSAEQQTIRDAARLLVLTGQIRLTLERAYEPIERSELLSVGVNRLREVVNSDLRGRWTSVSPAVLSILDRVNTRLRDFEQFTTISRDSFHLLRLARAELLGLSGRSREALRELERHTVFLSIQSHQLRAEVASRYFDFCVASGRFADGTRALLYLLSRSHSKWIHLPEMHRQFATIIRRHAAVRATGMARSARLLRVWGWFAARLRPPRFRYVANRLFFRWYSAESGPWRRPGRAAPAPHAPCGRWAGSAIF
jgi:hypothetical protein